MYVCTSAFFLEKKKTKQKIPQKTGSTGNQQQTDCLDETADRRKSYLFTFCQALI